MDEDTVSDTPAPTQVYFRRAFGRGGPYAGGFRRGVYHPYAGGFRRGSSERTSRSRFRD